MDGFGCDRRIAFVVGLFVLSSGKGGDQHGDLTVVCVDDSAWGGCVRGDDVHVCVEGGDAARGHVEGSDVRGKIGKRPESLSN